MAYDRVNWQDNISTPVSANNLNKMDSALFDHDTQLENIPNQTYIIDKAKQVDLNNINSSFINSLGLSVREQIGICGSYLDSNLAGKINACGFKYYRIDLAWSVIETSLGVYDFVGGTKNYDAINSLIISNGMIPYYILDYTNTLYGSEGNITTTAMRNAYKNFATACATHFKDQGCIFEIYNEPNVEGVWAGQTSGTPGQYATVVADVYNLIKSADKTAIVVAGALSGNNLTTASLFFDRACAAGLLNYCDAVSFHPYRINNPETRSADYDTYNGIIGKYSTRDIPIFCGEQGYSTCPAWDGLGNPVVVDETTQAKYLVRMILFNIMYGITKTNIYQQFDYNVATTTNVEYFFGIFRDNFTDKPSATMIKAVITPLLDYYFVERIPSTPNNYILKFVNQSGVFKYVAWTTDSSNNILVDNQTISLTDTPQIISTSNYKNISLLNRNIASRLVRAKNGAVQIVAAQVTDTGWLSITPINGATGTIWYRKQTFYTLKIVEVRINVSNFSSGKIIGYMPAGCFPFSDETHGLRVSNDLTNAGKNAAVQLGMTDGQLYVVPTTGVLSTDTISGNFSYSVV